MEGTMYVTDVQHKKLADDGFVIFPAVLNQDEVRRIREFVEYKLNDIKTTVLNGNSPTALFDIFGRHQELHWLLYHERTNAILKELLHEKMIVNLRATTLLHQKTSDWHNETMEIEAAGYSFPRDPDCRLLQTVFYLQDNKGSYGPALDLDIGSHKGGSCPFAGKEDYHPNNVFAPETESGDLLVFDWRLAHKATPAHDTTNGAARKFGIFGSYCNKINYAEMYNKFLDETDLYPYLQNFSYPNALVEEAKSRSIIMS